MDIKTGFFYLFSALLLFAAFRVITARNPVTAALYLMFAFFQAAAVWMLLRAEFLSIVLVLVYIGAVMVLFLFVVMMIDIDLDKLNQGFWKHFPLAAVVGAVIAFEMVAVLTSNVRLPEPMASSGALELSNTKELGRLLYSEYLYQLEIAAAILLVAMIAAIALTLRKRKDSKWVSSSEQLRVKPRDRVRVLDMDVTSAPAAIIPPDTDAATAQGAKT